MRIWQKSAIAMFCCGFALVAGVSASHSQTIWGSPDIALKGGETVELGDLYYVSHCRSLLKSTPEAEILEGPPGITVSVKEAMVLPRRQGCGNRVAGGRLTISANEIEDPSYSKLTVRVTYKTKDGDRKFSSVYNLSLVP